MTLTHWPFSWVSVGGMMLSSSASILSSSDSRRPVCETSSRHRVATRRCPPPSSSNRANTCCNNLQQQPITSTRATTYNNQTVSRPDATTCNNRQTLTTTILCQHLEQFARNKLWHHLLQQPATTTLCQHQSSPTLILTLTVRRRACWSCRWSSWTLRIPWAPRKRSTTTAGSPMIVSLATRSSDPCPASC